MKILNIVLNFFPYMLHTLFHSFYAFSLVENVENCQNIESQNKAKPINEYMGPNFWLTLHTIRPWDLWCSVSDKALESPDK